jgi:hypothetical protein
VPYPAGIIAFRNGLVTELIQQRAQYISDEQGGLKSLADLPAIDTVGPYILEGSKPGAAALACWLAHRSIPLTANEHGRIVRATLLSAQKLYRYLVNHRHMFRKIHFELTGQKGDLPHPFTFAPFFEPDTNIVCFLVRPMMFAVGNRLEETDIALHWINRLNRAIYARASISDVKDERHMPTAQPFYVVAHRVCGQPVRLRVDPAGAGAHEDRLHPRGVRAGGGLRAALHGDEPVVRAGGAGGDELFVQLCEVPAPHRARGDGADLPGDGGGIDRGFGGWGGLTRIQSEESARIRPVRVIRGLFQPALRVIRVESA